MNLRRMCIGAITDNLALLGGDGAEWIAAQTFPFKLLVLFVFHFSYGLTAGEDGRARHQGRGPFFEPSQKADTQAQVRGL